MSLHSSFATDRIEKHILIVIGRIAEWPYRIARGRKSTQYCGNQNSNYSRHYGTSDRVKNTRWIGSFLRHLDA